MSAETNHFDFDFEHLEDQVGRQDIVLFGGGSGTASVAPGFIEAMPDARFTIVTGTADSGGATGRLRQAFDTPAVGDSRRIMAALSRNPAGEIFERRFGDEGEQELDAAIADMREVSADFSPERREAVARTLDGIRNVLMPRLVQFETDLGRDGYKGQSFGNLYTTQRLLEGQGLAAAIGTVSRDLDVDRRINVVPVSEDSHHLVMLDGKNVYYEEGRIDDMELEEPHTAQVGVYNVEAGNAVRAHRAASEAITAADTIVVMPGSLYTSIGASASVPGIKQAFAANKQHDGRLVTIANMTVDRDTRGMKLAEYIAKQGQLLGRVVDLTLVNEVTEGLPEGKVPFSYDASQLPDMRVVTAALADVTGAESADPNDAIAHLRSQVKTNGAVAARVIRERLTA